MSSVRGEFEADEREAFDDRSDGSIGRFNEIDSDRFRRFDEIGDSDDSMVSDEVRRWRFAWRWTEDGMERDR